MTMEVLGKLEPKAVMHWFEEISSIPRRSLKEEKIAAYIMRFAQERGLECSEDETHNVLVRKPASVGREDRPALVLQSHMDMIYAKGSGVEHDFESDGLELYVDGDKIRARGTTLGADNGIGVAYQLAILDDNTLTHPAIEAVFTTAEEIGMIGAIRFDAARLKGKSMINFDAGGFTEGRIYVGCAGNQRGRLTQILRYGNVRQTDTSMIATVVNGMVARICVGLPAICTAINDEAAAQVFRNIVDVQQAMAVLDAPDQYNLWYEADAYG
jgi:dipeptidase D